MIYKSSDLAIIIPSKNYKNINICLESIKKQSKKPGQTIIVFDKKKNFKSSKKIIFSHTRQANQVLQRTHGLSLINKKIKLILQLDDKFYLHTKAIENLIKDWNLADKNIAGIGIKSNLKDSNKDKFNFLRYFFLTGSDEPGKVLKSGFNNQYISKKKITNVDWLQGGLSSWKLKYVPHIFKRKFPLTKWSIVEDLIFSYNVKYKKKFQLKVSNNSKAYLINKQNEEFSCSENYYRGYQYSKMHKTFVYINTENLSKIAFYYGHIASSILGIFCYSLFFKKKFFFYLGRFIGIFADIKKVKVL